MKTFACDESAIKGESFLRADYSISCHSNKHRIYTVYAMFMVLVSDFTTVRYSFGAASRPIISCEHFFRSETVDVSSTA